jgi:CubicO group peptidase (beta-lactamase class C family)
MMEGGKLGFLYPPGERFSYSGEAFTFLQFIIEQITGTTIDVLARERIFIPLGMTRTSYVWDEAFEANCADGHTERQRRLKITRSPEADAGGSLVTTAADFSRFAAAVMGAKGLKQASVDQMLAPQVRVVSKRMFGPLTREKREDTTAIHLSWGLGWGLFAGDFGSAFFHTGHAPGWENYAVAYRNQKIGLVLLSNSSNFESIAQRITERAIGDRNSPFEWLGFQRFDQSTRPAPPEPERETVPIDSATCSAVVGEYEVRPGDSILLRLKDGRLVGSGDGKTWDEVMAVSETEFFIDGKPYDFSFRRDSTGAVVGMVISYQGMEIPAKKTK